MGILGSICSAGWKIATGTVKCAVRLTGMGARGLAKGASFLAQAGGEIAGGATEIAGNVAGGLVGCVNERAGDFIKNTAKTIANVERMPGKAVGAAAEATVGVVTGVASIVVGDDEGAEAAKESVQDAVFGTEDFVEGATETAKQAFENLTAESCFKEAKYKYYALENENEKMCKELSAVRDALNGRIDDAVSRINSDKQIVKESFERFIAVASSIADWKIATYDSFDTFVSTTVKPAPIQTKRQVFSDVDFDSEPIWNSFKGVITLGFLTESQVKDAEVTIANHRKAAKAKWADDKEDNNQLERVAESLEFVRESFDTFLAFYGSMIDELKYAVTLLKRTQGLLDPFYFDEDGRINLYFMPRRHVLALMACDKLSRVLCEMAKRCYVVQNAGKTEAVEQDEKLVRNFKDDEFEAVHRSLAA